MTIYPITTTGHKHRGVFVVMASVSHCVPSAVLPLPGDMEGEEHWSFCWVGFIVNIPKVLLLLVISRLLL